MNWVLHTENFWRSYFTLKPVDFFEDDFEVQIAGLGEDYTIRTDFIKWEREGKEHSAVRRVVEFPFVCGENFTLLLEYEPDTYGCQKELFLVDARSGTKSRMGWWDLICWHPYCLRLSEFEILLHFWNRYDPSWSNSEIPLLLLGDFVGICDIADLYRLNERFKTAFQNLGLQGFTPEKTTASLEIKTDYRWEVDAELGWIFTGDLCWSYSIRNRPHMEADEKTFPFQPFREMLAQIEDQIRNEI